MAKGIHRLLAITAATAMGAACTVHQTEQPPLSGPSTFALSVQIHAVPDRITQDGTSQSSIQVMAIGPTGSPLSGIAFRLDMIAGGSLVDFGALSSRTIVTGTDGTARTVYTAPPPSPGPNTPVQTVSIRAVPIGNDAFASISTTVDIRLMPPGIILPPADTPTAQFTITPSGVNMNIPATFDASASCAGTPPCTPGASITSFSWNFGDNTALATGMTVQHTFKTPGTFSVTLTVTNNRGVAASTTQTVTVGTSAPPSGDWTFSPTNPNVGDKVVFNADRVLPAPGRTIVQYSWDFGDGGTGSGFLVTHSFAVAQTYSVVLTVRDDADQKVAISKTVPVGAGNPTAQITFSPTSPVVGAPVIFDASAVTTVGGATIVSYQWTFGDGGTSSTGPTTTHTFALANAYVVRLIVTDSQNRTATATVTVTVGTGNPVPVITFSPSAPVHLVTSVTFDASGTTTSGGATITTFAWNFGDGATGSGQTVTHTFATAGTFTVRVTVTDSLGRTGTATVTVTVT